MSRTTCKLIDILQDIHSGGTPSTEVREYWNGELKWLSSGETSERFISDTKDKITPLGVEQSSTKLAHKNNIVMACAGQGKTRGQVSFLLDDMYVNQSVIVLEPDQEKMLPLYLFYNLSNRYDELRGGSDASSTRGSITTTALKKLPMDFPDVKQQEKIVEVLFKYDQLIENYKKQMMILENTAREIYKEWFVRLRFPGHENASFHNGIPIAWSMIHIEDFCDVTDGTHDTPSPTEDGVPLITGKCLKNGFVDFSMSYNISIDDHENIKKRSGLKTGDILFSNIGTVGTTCIVDYDREFSVKNVIIFKMDSMNKTMYLYYWLTSDAMQEIFSSQTNGASQQFVGLNFMRKYKFLKPDDELINKFSDYVKPLFHKKNLLYKESLLLQKQRDMLLKRMMKGSMSFD